MDVTTIAVGIVNFLALVLVGWVMFDKGKAEREFTSFKSLCEKRHTDFIKEISSVTIKQTEHSNSFVDDDKVRRIFTTLIIPLEKESQSTKNSMEKIVDSIQDLTVELRVNNRMREREKEERERERELKSK